MQNAMPMTMSNSKDKPKIEFQYGVRPFSETGSRNNSTVDEISSLSVQNLVCAWNQILQERQKTFWRRRYPHLFVHFQTYVFESTTNINAIISIIKFFLEI